MECRARAIGGIALAAAVACAAAFAASYPAASDRLTEGWNTYPVQLQRPPAVPLSAMAELGRLVFHDARLSSSGRLSCAVCHNADHAYSSATDTPVMAGGPDLSRPGVRAVPSLMYLEREPNFSIGPDNEENETVSLAQMALFGATAARAQKTATDTAATAANVVPQGGLFWDGRADTLQNQALSPLLDPREMDGGSIAEVAQKLRHAPYAARFIALFGAPVFETPAQTVAEALFAVARYEIEEQHFHPYTSKFDYWLEGKARMNAAELSGYILYNDPAKADCGGCHLDRPSPDGLPPLFTDHQFEALGVPRNEALAANRDKAYFDLGLCGPYRADLRGDPQYCGMFITPTLRNIATRKVFFHNGLYRTLQQVLDFYDFRDTDPAKIYPRRADGTVAKYDDLPEHYRANIDVTDPPFDRHLGDKPAMSAADERDIIAFLGMLTDGYRAETR
jgi:cytochrome c peroxidase